MEPLVKLAPGICALAADVGYDSDLGDMNPPPRILMFISCTQAGLYNLYSISASITSHASHLFFILLLDIKGLALSLSYSLFIYILLCIYIFIVFYILSQHIGCDWGIDSSAKEDRCGVCHGDGSTCETIKDQYNETQGMGVLCCYISFD